MATNPDPSNDELDFPDSDSAIGSETSSTYTESLRSTLLESVKENGRSYHKYRDGHYILPEDELERNRLDMQHEMCLKTLGGKLHLAPIPDNLHHALDLGTGTGIWAIDFADAHPETQVIGTDLSLMQPHLVPPNCKFEVDDFEQPWTFPQKFDYIHGRMMLTSFTDGKRLMQQCYDGCTPGGWVEIMDVQMPIKADDETMDGTSWAHWNDLFFEAMLKIGRDPSWAGRFKEWMEAVGFENVVQVEYKWPQNAWPKDKHLKDLGLWNMINTLDGLYGFTARPFTQLLGMSVEEVEVLLIQCRKDIQNRKIHAYWPLVVIYGQKPGGPTRISAETASRVDAPGQVEKSAT